MQDPKRPRRKRDPELLRRLRREATECALCGVPPPLDPHHVYPRAQGGSDVPENIVMLDDGLEIADEPLIAAIDPDIHAVLQDNPQGPPGDEPRAA